MKPNFALSLSFQGIRLLHRAAGGWRLVGEVALDTDDLSGDLAALRRDALQLAPEGILSKLLLPNDQIKYLSISTPGQNPEQRKSAARQALAGATPYAVDELAFDISVDGDQTHIAAVALETLDEAEAFALEHDFGPVSFAAVPGDMPYLGEPFFGTSKAAADLLPPGEDLSPDGIAVVVIGKADLSAPPAPALEAEAPQAELPAADPVPAEPAPEPEIAAEPDAEQPIAQQSAAQDAPPPPAETSETAEETPAPEKPALLPKLPGLSRARRVRVPESKGAVSASDAVPAAPPPPLPDLGEGQAGFSSRRAAPKLGGAERGLPASDPLKAAAVTAPALPIDPDSSSLDAPVPAPDPQAPAEKAGFLSRRKHQPPAPETEDHATESERLTIFGARQKDVGGKPRYLGIILTIVLLVFLAGVAAWASVFADDEFSLWDIFGREPAPQTAVVEPVMPELEDAPEVIETAALDPALSDEDSAVLDALSTPEEAPELRPMTEAELEAKYATTGIWARAPQVPPAPPALIGIDDFYLTSIDPVSTANDAIALPPVAEFDRDAALVPPASPAAPGTRFALDARGLVIPTPEGALSPDGVMVYLGRPEITPPRTPTRFEAEPKETTQRNALAGFRPKARPQDLSESHERSTLGGLTRSELAEIRPELRPPSLQEQAAAARSADAIDTDEAVTAALAEPETTDFDNPTRLAIAASRRPDDRPRNFARIVKRAQNNPDNAPQQVASLAQVAPKTVKPKIPSKTSVAKQATVKNAINLSKINLIGVYGKPSNRRALVRLKNGRYKKVEVGDRIDGGRVSAIGDSELRYTKSGRNVILRLPKG